MENGTKYALLTSKTCAQKYLRVFENIQDKNGHYELKNML